MVIVAVSESTALLAHFVCGEEPLGVFGLRKRFNALVGEHLGVVCFCSKRSPAELLRFFSEPKIPRIERLRPAPDARGLRAPLELAWWFLDRIFAAHSNRRCGVHSSTHGVPPPVFLRWWCVSPALHSGVDCNAHVVVNISTVCSLYEPQSARSSVRAGR